MLLLLMRHARYFAAAHADAALYADYFRRRYFHAAIYFALRAAPLIFLSDFSSPPFAAAPALIFQLRFLYYAAMPRAQSAAMPASAALCSALYGIAQMRYVDVDMHARKRRLPPPLMLITCRHVFLYARRVATPCAATP